MLKRAVAAVGMIALFAVAFMWLNHMPLNLASGQQAMLTVTFRNIPRANEICRNVSEAEKATMLPHMRRDRICERSRAITWIRVLVDGQELIHKAFKPLGFQSDGIAAALESFVMTAGRHDLHVLLRDTEKGDDWSYEFRREIEFEKDRRYLVEFQKETGFKVY